MGADPVSSVCAHSSLVTLVMCGVGQVGVSWLPAPRPCPSRQEGLGNLTSFIFIHERQRERERGEGSGEVESEGNREGCWGSHASLVSWSPRPGSGPDDQGELQLRQHLLTDSGHVWGPAGSFRSHAGHSQWAQDPRPPPLPPASFTSGAWETSPINYSPSQRVRFSL